MKIIELRGENIKKMRAFHIKPNGETVIIGGKNGQGKSSCLDSIVLGLGGKSSEVAKLTTKPIREGEKEAWVEIDVGDFKVKRTWTERSDYLEVLSKDGSKFASPQKMLDALLGDLSFDPLEFARLPAKEQRAMLLQLVDIGMDLDAWQKNYDDVYAKRTEIGREVKRLEGAATSLGNFAPEVPDEEVSVVELSKTLEALRKRNVTAHELQSEKISCEKKIQMKKDQIDILENEIDELLMRGDKIDDELEEVGHADPIEVSRIEQMITEADETNKKVRAKKQYTDLETQLIKEQQRYEKGSKYLEEQDKAKAEALAAAQMPIKGLGIDADGITFKGIPFGQLSQAEQIKVSMGIAMAQNPKLRFIRINDGSLLDDDNLAAVQAMADANDFQLLIERVGTADKMAVIIEDGMIVDSPAAQ